jgi:hypothetical protein
MNHLEFTASESAALEPSDWENWAFEVEAILGHTLDGDQTLDGYSQDYASDAWEAGKTPEEHAETVRNGKARVRLVELAEYLNKRYAVGVVTLSTTGPRQGLDDETPFLQIARGHTPSDVVVAVGIGDTPHYRIEVYTATAWFNPGDLPFTRLSELCVSDAAHMIQRYVPYVPTV